MDRLAALCTLLLILACSLLSVDVLAGGVPGPGGVPSEVSLPDAPPEAAPDEQPATAPDALIDPDNPPPPGTLASIGGIIGLTALIVELLKRNGAQWPVVKDTPTWFISVIVATALVVVARYVLHTMDGNFGEMVMNVIVGVVGANAGQAILTNLNATPKTFAIAKAR